MRIRRKPWARPEIAQCPFCISCPQELKGKWKSAFKNSELPLHIELGCGKGGFVSVSAVQNPDINYIAIDIKPEMLALAKRKTEQAFAQCQRSVDNVRLFVYNIDKIDEVFDKNDNAERIYINFCNPWPRNTHKKRRLTYHRYLMKYREFLKGELWFKTDDDDLFKESLKYFEQSGYEIIYKTFDLHSSGFEGSIETEHEKMFTEMGKNIKFLIAKPVDITYDQYLKNIEYRSES